MFSREQPVRAEQERVVIAAQFPHRKGLNFSPHNFRTTPIAPHNPAQDFQPNIAHKCEIVLANQVVVSYRDGSLIASVGNYEQ
jgi:hypothetical protein